MSKRKPRERDVTRSIVVQEAKRNPYLGVRKLTALLKNKHQITISKSTINNILRNSGQENQPGRKRETLLYQRRPLEECGAFLLRALDSRVGLFDHVAANCSRYMPQIKEKQLKKLLMLISFSIFLHKKLGRSTDIREILRSIGFYSYPSRNVNFLTDMVTHFRPMVDLEPLAADLDDCATIKFYFNNNSSSFCDASMCGFWDRPCHIEQFFLPLQTARRRLALMLEDKAVIVNYTRSFDYISPLVVNFINGLASGIKHIEFLSAKGAVLDEIAGNGQSPSFFIGYYPKILSKGVFFLRTEKRFKKIEHVTGDIFYLSAVTQFFPPKDSKGIILNSILLRRNTRFLPCWGILTNKKTDISSLVNRYLSLWPYMDTVFLEDMDSFQNFYTNAAKHDKVASLLPLAFSFAKTEDLAQMPALLEKVFHNLLGDMQLRHLKGHVITTKGAVKLLIRKIPLDIKKKFNRRAFTLDDRRVFLV